MRRYFTWILLPIFLALSFALAHLRLNPGRDFHPTRGQLRVGWVEVYPYQMSQQDKSFLRRDGLGYRIVEACLDKAGYEMDFVAMDWDSQLKALEAGELDVVMLAARSSQREAFAHFSDPYLSLQFGLFQRRESESQSNISRTKNYAYPASIEAIQEKARQEGRLLEVKNDFQNLELLLDGQTDRAYIDELTGLSCLHDMQVEGEIVYQRLDLPAQPQHVMFSKKTVSPEVVDRFNQALKELDSSQQKARLVRNFYYPRLLSLITQHQAFRMLAISGAIFAGFTGILLAHREGYDLVGAFALAGCPAVGGGLIRDLVAGRSPVAMVTDPISLLSVTILVALGWVFFRVAPLRLRQHVESLDPGSDPGLLFIDSLGLGSYTVLTVLTAMQTNCEPLWLWGPLLAMVQNGGGGILRDLLRGKGGQIAILRGTYYGEIAAFWALLLSLYFMHQSSQPTTEVSHLVGAMILTVIGVILTRSLIVAKGWKSPAY